MTPLGPAPYGYCPRCGAPGIARERRIHGNDQCPNGHTYASLDALTEAPAARSSVEYPEPIAEFIQIQPE